MHLVIVTSGYYGPSGALTNARELANHLSDRGQMITILAPDVNPPQDNELLRFVRILDIPMIAQNLFYFSSLCRVHRHRPIEIIQTNDRIAFLTVYPFERLYGVPTVFSMQASIFNGMRSVDYSWLTTQNY